MPWREAVQPVRMQRVAVVAPRPLLRDVLVRVADAGTVEIDRGDGQGGTPETAGAAGQRLQRMHPDRPPEPAVSRRAPDLDSLERENRADLMAGEAEVESCVAAAVVRGDVAALAGWSPAAAVPGLAARLSEVGGGLVPLASPRGVDPPTLLRSGGGVRRSFSPLVETYATVPYADLDPTPLAGLAYVVMFGMMFGDAGHGALLVVLGLLMSFGRPARLARFRKVWPFVVGAGLAAVTFGLLYGEFFGPTGVIPVLWLSPLDEPVTLLAASLGVGAVLLAGAYVVGTVNRWREGGWPLALSAPSGVAGASLFAGLGLILLGSNTGLEWLVAVGVLVSGGGLVLAFLGFVVAAEGEAGGGRASRVAQASVELFDAVIRLGANIVSFARLAAFGLTHAALGQVVWDGTTALWQRGGLLVLGAVAVFVIGNAIAFTLEALVAGVQALRLEYYELFSRIFSGEGRPFRPWRVPVDPTYDTGSAGAATAHPTSRGRST